MNNETTTTTTSTFEPVIYNNDGGLTLVTSAQSYVECVLHDMEAIESRCETKTFDYLGEEQTYTSWSIWFKDRYCWSAISTSGVCETEDAAWQSAMDYYDGRCYTGSDNARFETIDSIKDFIAEIENDEDYSEELEAQRSMLKMLESVQA